jgi:hypothetical protein
MRRRLAPSAALGAIASALELWGVVPGPDCGTALNDGLNDALTDTLAGSFFM